MRAAGAIIVIVTLIAILSLIARIEAYPVPDQMPWTHLPRTSMSIIEHR